MSDSYAFDDAVSLSLTPEGELSGQVSDKYLINGVPNGGYLMAMLTQAAFLQGKRNAPVSVTANFMRRSVTGPMEFSCDVMNQSKQFDRFAISAKQQGKENIRAFVTLMNEFPAGDATRYEKPRLELLPRSECTQTLALPGYTMFNNVTVLMEPQCFEWIKGRPAERSEHKGWIKLNEDRPWDALSVLMAADAFPPPLLASHGMVAWIPTIEMSVQLRKVPKTQWLKGVFRTNYITDGLVEEDGEIWDEEGNLVAISRQLAQFKKGKISTPVKLGLKAAGLYLSWQQRKQRK